MTELATTPAAQTQAEEVTAVTVSGNWWRIGDAVVLALYATVVLWTVGYHEKWADEAQAWLLARDLDLKTLWFHELRYEGSPGLWHTILYVAQHVFHMRYDALGYLGATFAIAGAAVLIFLAPFPRYVRWPLAFTYVMVYQYAVIARPYTLLPLLCFLAAIFFKDIRHPARMTVVLVLLSNLTLHGTIIAGCVGLAYLVQAIRLWRKLEPDVQRSYVICITFMALTFLFLFFILKPTADVAEFAPKSTFERLIPKATPEQKVVSALSGAFLDQPLASLLFVLAAAAWCAMRGKLIAFALPVFILTALYTVIHGYAHHHGTLFIAALAGLWIAWPDQHEQDGFATRDRWALRGVVALLLCLCAVNVADAAVVIQREYRYPYSGAEDAARYLRSVGAIDKPMFGYLFGIVAVQAYFDHNIFANRPTTYFHLDSHQAGTTLDLIELQRAKPEYVVAYSIDPQVLMDKNGPMFAAAGYELAHFSDGYYLYKQGVYQREAYLIFRRVQAPGGPAAWQQRPW